MAIPPTGPTPPLHVRLQEIEEKCRSQFPDRILTILDRAKIYLRNLPTIAKNGIPTPDDMTDTVAHVVAGKRTGLAFLLNLKEKDVWHVTPRMDIRGMHPETKKGFDVKTNHSTVLSLFRSKDNISNNDLKNLPGWFYCSDNSDIHREKIDRAFQEKGQYPVYGCPDYDAIEAAVLGEHPDFEMANGPNSQA